MDVDQRIEQFAKMAEADPENELGHFSLGKALAEAGRFDEAITPLRRVLDINPEYSKAYEVLAAAQRDLNDREAAVATLRSGIDVSDRRGDRMPRDAMARMLRDLGETPPELKNPPRKQAAPPPGSDLTCSRCGRAASRMDKQPFKGELGERVLNHVCEPCWREWVGVGTKVINEMGLALSSPQAQQIYDEHMIEFLQLEQ